MRSFDMTVLGYTSSGMIRVVFEGDETESFVPDDMANHHRQMIAQWEADGNVIPAYVGAPPNLDDYRSAIQAVVDQVAQVRRYDSGNSLASYANSTNPSWAAEAQAFIAWRDSVWAFAYDELARVEAGQRPQPTVEQIVSELTPIRWPVTAL
jgi:hypothetical protein